MKSKWAKEMPKKLFKAMSEGYSFGGACGVLGISRATGYHWVEKHKEFAEAHARGQEKRLMFLEERAISLMEYSKDRSAALVIFLLKTADRKQYGEELQKQAPPEDPLDNMPDDVLEKKAIQVMRQRGLKVVGSSKKET